MVSFRSAEDQARHAVENMLAIGKPRPKINDWKIYSLGTARTYTESLTGVARFMAKFRMGTRRKGLADLTPAIANKYLAVRSDQVGQKQLDKDRQAMQALLKQNLPVIQSEVDLATSSRAYTTQQIEMISEAQWGKHSFSTRVAAEAGLRAHELLTLLPVSERAADKRTPDEGGRYWSVNRFKGRDQIKIYTVEGKGGLVRQVALSHKLAEELEQRRLPVPVQVTDRKIFYDQHYALGGGKKWSDSFSKAAKRRLGWSAGAHGTRHTYAQSRMKELQQLGYPYQEALEIVSQEMGHFRPQITEVYLR